jgi:drug/metabolite transporter (DMT)-like permease
MMKVAIEDHTHSFSDEETGEFRDVVLKKPSAAVSEEKNEISPELVYHCTMFILAGASEYWIFAWLREMFQIRVPILSAIIQNSTWMVQGMNYARERKAWEKRNGPRVISSSMYQAYILLGVLNAATSLSRTIGLTSLPPTLYAVIANTDLVFQALLTKLVLGRALSVLQIGAVVCVIAGLLISLYDPIAKKYGSNENISEAQLITGVTIALFARLTGVLNTVLADRYSHFALVFIVVINIFY